MNTIITILTLVTAINQFANKVQAQYWNTTGNIIAGIEYLGADAGSTVSLKLKTIPALDINFFTSNVQRMSQNRDDANYRQMISELEKLNDFNAQQVAGEMSKRRDIKNIRTEPLNHCVEIL